MSSNLFFLSSRTTVSDGLCSMVAPVKVATPWCSSRYVIRCMQLVVSNYRSMINNTTLVLYYTISATCTCKFDMTLYVMYKTYMYVHVYVYMYIIINVHVLRTHLSTCTCTCACSSEHLSGVHFRDKTLLFPWYEFNLRQSVVRTSRCRIIHCS